MQALRNALETIRTRLSGLPASAKLLAGSLVVILALGLFLVAQYSARSDAVAFAITPPISADLPTTFRYDPVDFFGTFAGSINHRGTITFNNAITVGNFEIFFDNGFKVADRESGLGVLFNVAVTSATPTVDRFEATGNLLVSANFASLLLQLGLANANLTGADVGDAYIQGLNSGIPSPAGIALLGLAGLCGVRGRRR